MRWERPYACWCWSGAISCCRYLHVFRHVRTPARWASAGPELHWVPSYVPFYIFLSFHFDVFSPLKRLNLLSFLPFFEPFVWSFFALCLLHPLLRWFLRHRHQHHSGGAAKIDWAVAVMQEPTFFVIWNGGFARNQIDKEVDLMIMRGWISLPFCGNKAALHGWGSTSSGYGRLNMKFQFRVRNVSDRADCFCGFQSSSSGECSDFSFQLPTTHNQKPSISINQKPTTPCFQVFSSGDILESWTSLNCQPWNFCESFLFLLPPEEPKQLGGYGCGLAPTIHPSRRSASKVRNNG